MIRQALFALTIAVSGAAAQQPHPGAHHTAPTDSITAQLVGVWEGSFKSHGPQGQIRIEFTRDSVLRARTEFVGMTFGDGAFNLVALDRNSASWTQTLMSEGCKTWAVLTNGTLDGEIACGEVTFSLKKKAK
ncbi:MAG: hypothetical protein ABIR92_02665 [Gemmatimonadaceae bacterium]